MRDLFSIHVYVKKNGEVSVDVYAPTAENDKHFSLNKDNGVEENEYHKDEDGIEFDNLD